MVRRLVIALAVTVLGAVVMAPVAQADFGIAKWESITCKTDATNPAPAVGPPSGDPCVVANPPERFYTQAAGHPNFGATAFIMNQTGGIPNFPDGKLKEIRVELPAGLGVNPEATIKCTEAALATKACPPESRVGTNYLTTISSGAVGLPPAGTEFTLPAAVYNIVPPPGVVSQAGFNATGVPTYLVGDLDPVDQHISFTIFDLNPAVPIIGSRLVFNGKAGNGYLTMPSLCGVPPKTTLKVTSYPYPTPADPEQHRSSTSVAPVVVSGCAAVPFKPTIGVTPEGGAVDSPEPVTAEVKIPYEPGPEVITNSYLRTAKVTLPEGSGLNPSTANGLVPCTDAQFAKGTNNPIACPASSEIGTVTVESPSLPDGSVGGNVYIAQPLSNDPTSGNQFRIFIHASGPERGVNVRLVGNVFPNLKTGQLTAVIDENPEAPFDSFQIHLKGGPRGALTSPPICGPNTTTGVFTPWTGTADVTETSSFTLTSLPGGGACPKTMAERPFAPPYTAKSDSTKANAYSPFRVHIGRPDGQQELKGVNVTLPKGLTAKLAGVPYCSEAALVAAAANSGVAEQASSSCSGASQIGTTSTDAGTGAEPLRIAGKAFLAGPYKGAPLSMAVITPAVAGPYDLGTVVVRVALNVNPKTAQVNAVSDVIPDVFGGVKLDLRSVDVNVDRSKFMRNPTNCALGATAGFLNGGGADPTNPATFSSYAVSAAYQASQCGKLNFKPKLFTRLYGGTKRDQNPRIRAILEAREGDANVSRTALTLPHSLFLDQSHIRTVCTRVQLAAKDCPKAAIYGHAKAKSPLLDRKLKGPVYLVSSDNLLPDLVADLRGQVNIQLHGVISSKRGGLKTVFDSVPDVPVKKFILTMEKGNKSLLVNSRDLCGGPQSSVLNIKAQNGKKVKNNKLPLRVSACGKKKK